MSEKGELIPVARIYPNRLNPNEMKNENKEALMRAIAEDDYDPIIISPATVFYDKETLSTLDLTREQKIAAADFEECYIICDGFHRFTEALNLKLKEIRAVIWHMTETDAMPYFFTRHKIKGDLDPLKEARLFQYERIKGRTNKEIMVKYNLSSVGYLTDRLRLLGLSVAVTKLFYNPPKNAKRPLSMSHIRLISYLPNKLQKPVALVSLERNWSVEDLENEIRRIKAGKGIRGPSSYVAPPIGMPPSREGGTSTREKAKPVKNAEIIPDERLLKDYPPEYLIEDEPIPQQIESKPVTAELTQLEVASGVGEAHVEQIARMGGKQYLTMEILLNFVEKVFKLAVAEGFDLLVEKKIDGRSPNQWLIDEISDELDSFIITWESEPDLRALTAIALRACQLYYRHRG